MKEENSHKSPSRYRQIFTACRFQKLNRPQFISYASVSHAGMSSTAISPSLPHLGFTCLPDTCCSLCALCTPFFLLFSATPTQKLPFPTVTTGEHSEAIQQSLTKHVFGSVNGAEVPYVRLNDTQAGVFCSFRISLWCLILISQFYFIRFCFSYSIFFFLCFSRLSSPPRTSQQRNSAIVNTTPRTNERLGSDFEVSLFFAAKTRGLESPEQFEHEVPTCCGSWFLVPAFTTESRITTVGKPAVVVSSR